MTSAARPTISIAMATCDGARYLAEQLDSFLSQTVRPDELVVSDDSSTDDTPAIVEAFARRAAFPVRLQRNPERLGVERNFQKALGLTTGDIIFMSDQDDVWFPQKIERMAGVLAAEPGTFIVICDQIVTRADLSHEGTSKMRNAVSLGFGLHSSCAGCTTALRREYLRYALPIPPSISYDGWISVLAGELGKRTFLEEPLQYWRRHGSNVTNSAVASLLPATRPSIRPRVDPRPGWDTFVHRNELFIARLEAIAADAHDGDVARRAALSLPRLKRSQRIVSARIKLTNRRRWQRPFLAAALFACGQYRSLKEVRDAAADVLRRCQPQ